MKETYNWKSLFAGMGIIVVGFVISLISKRIELWENALLSIGCSLIASGVVILAHDFFVEKRKVSLLDEWKIDHIYSTRAEKNADSDLELQKAKYCLDAVAFGLGSFRSKQTPKVEQILRKGVNIRILTMDPNSPYATVRDIEENKREGATAYSIQQLVSWANDLNSKNMKGKIEIRGYNSMTLDFYWRVDDVLFVGPYWYGVDSQQTITYRFLAGGKGFSQYTEYFESLWNNEKLCQTLTNEMIRAPKKRKQ